MVIAVAIVIFAVITYPKWSYKYWWEEKLNESEELK